MGYISSKYMLINQNPPVNESKIVRIEPVSSNLTDSNLSVLYFYSRDKLGYEKPVRAWFYESRDRLLEELNFIQLNHPQIPVG
ncbi:hypothetical protein [Salmonirosea aquatica]|uniref:Uncharacterized protein n=1 Tax=Salmonirosea aquatica TaxID=2654236 RepID=A0A7C9FZK8_9BACT|nr:hypothetical protein [Cytophagaceae bacterium SJW1-29]